MNVNKNNNDNNPWESGGNNPWGGGSSGNKDLEDSIKKLKKNLVNLKSVDLETFQY